MPISLQPQPELPSLRRAYARDGFVQVPDVLSPASAQRVHRCLVDGTPWSRVFNQGGKHVDVAEEQIHALPGADLARLEDAIGAQARDGFQYYYRNYPIHDAVRQGLNEGHLLHAFHAFVNSADFLRLARDLTGCDDITFADAQATCFLPGHFLTEHDDHAEGKDRRAAYIFNFTPAWRPDWGGYLQLYDRHGDVRRGLMPAFNVLNLLAVPQPHSVGQVASFAGAPRLSITGWLRAGEPAPGMPS